MEFFFVNKKLELNINPTDHNRSTTLSQPKKEHLDQNIITTDKIYFSTAANRYSKKNLRQSRNNYKN